MLNTGHTPAKFINQDEAAVCSVLRGGPEARGKALQGARRRVHNSNANRTAHLSDVRDVLHFHEEAAGVVFKRVIGSCGMEASEKKNGDMSVEAARKTVFGAAKEGGLAPER